MSDESASYKKSFRISMAVIFLTQAFLAVFMLYPSVLRDQGFSLGLSGWLMSIFNICSTLGRPLGAMTTERLGIRTTLLWTSGLVAVFTLPLAFTERPLLLLSLRGIGGVFWGISMVAISSYQGISIPAGRRGSAYAWIAVAYVFPQVTLFPLADWFASSGMLTAYFLLAVAVEAAIVVVAAPLPPVRRADGEKEAPKEWGKWSELPSLPGFRAVLATMFLFAFVNASTLQFLPAFLAARGFPASVFIVPNALTAVALRLVAYRIMDRINRQRTIGIVIAAMGFYIILSPLRPGAGLVCGWRHILRRRHGNVLPHSARPHAGHLSRSPAAQGDLPLSLCHRPWIHPFPVLPRIRRAAFRPREHPLRHRSSRSSRRLSAAHGMESKKERSTPERKCFLTRERRTLQWRKIPAASEGSFSIIPESFQAAETSAFHSLVHLISGTAGGPIYERPDHLMVRRTC